MNVQVINLIIKAIKNTSNMTIQTEVENGKPKLVGSPVPEEGICVLVGTTGELKGQVVLSFEKEKALEISNKMMQGLGSGEWDKMAKSAIREFANMTLGTFSTLLNQEEINIDITPPTLIEGKGIELSGEKGIKVPILNNNEKFMSLTIMLKD
jgi:chemotaxis protein CheX